MTRRAVLALAIAAFGLASLLSGCRSDSAPNVDVSIVGKWKLVESSGGITGGGQIPLPDMTVEFTTEGAMMRYENDEVTYSIPYSIGMDKTVFSLDPAPVIYLNDEPFYAYSFPDEDTLVLSENGCDGFSDEYQRI